MNIHNYKHNIINIYFNRIININNRVYSNYQIVNKQKVYKYPLLYFFMAKQKKSLREFFLVAETDEVWSRIETFVRGQSPKKALDDFVAQFPPHGEKALFPLQFADLYSDANAYHKGKKPLATLYKETSEYPMRE